MLTVEDVLYQIKQDNERKVIVHWNLSEGIEPVTVGEEWGISVVNDTELTADMYNRMYKGAGSGHIFPIETIDEGLQLYRDLGIYHNSQEPDMNAIDLTNVKEDQPLYLYIHVRMLHEYVRK